MKSAAFFSSIRIHCKLNSSFNLMPLSVINVWIRISTLGVSRSEFGSASMTPFSGETVPLMGLVDDNPLF